MLQARSLKIYFFQQLTRILLTFKCNTQAESIDGIGVGQRKVIFSKVSIGCIKSAHPTRIGRFFGAGIKNFGQVPHSPADGSEV